jgi:hypothetical protein
MSADPGGIEAPLHVSGSPESGEDREGVLA